jgi:hypothetical protein
MLVPAIVVSKPPFVHHTAAHLPCRRSLHFVDSVCFYICICFAQLTWCSAFGIGWSFDLCIEVILTKTSKACPVAMIVYKRGVLGHRHPRFVVSYLCSTPTPEFLTSLRPAVLRFTEGVCFPHRYRRYCGSLFLPLGLENGNWPVSCTDDRLDRSDLQSTVQNCLSRSC